VTLSRSRMVTLTYLDDAGCLERIYGRALVASSLSLKEMTTVDGAPTSSYDKLVTVIVETYTTIPCSTESTDIGVGTTMVSKHSTSTDLLTVTVTSSSRYDTVRNTDSLVDYDSQQHFHC
jgi:hypothetical protein